MNPKPVLIGAILCSAAIASMASGADLCFKDKLTGGAETIDSSGILFGMTANAIQTRKKLVGHIQYSRDDEFGEPLLYVHSKVECAGWADNGENLLVVVAGPATVQHNPGLLETGDWLVAGVEDIGIGAGDQVRVIFANQTDAEDYCEDPASLLDFPGVVQQGEFKIRIADECAEPPVQTDSEGPGNGNGNAYGLSKQENNNRNNNGRNSDE
jgi:hypothetical protein